MAKLTYAMNASADGFMEDEDGRFDWSEPDVELHQAFNDMERAVGTSLYGRRLYEAMAVWQTLGLGDGRELTQVEREYGEIWRDADKIVFSTSLSEVTTPRTRLERIFDPEAVRRLKNEADADLSIGGVGLAASAFEAGLVDEVQLFVHPVLVGGGKPALPRGVRVDLELLSERRFGCGVVQLHYRVR